MVVLSILFILFGIAIWVFPELLSIIVGSVFVFIGLVSLWSYFLIKKRFKKAKENVFEVFGYKVYKDKK